MRTDLAVGMTGNAFVNAANANFTYIYRGNIKYAEDYGFATTATATVNTESLQSALLGGGTVFLKKGTYEVNGTIYIDSNTSINCEPGTVLKKSTSFAQVFINRGALTKEWNENITINNLTIDCNSRMAASSIVRGLNGSMPFYYIKKLTITNFKSINSTYDDLMFFFVRFEDVILDHIEITGVQCGINIMCGKTMLINRYIAETQDDAVFIGAGWEQNLTEVGDVSDVTFTNSIDRLYTGQTIVGYFCRAYTTSWADWKTGNSYSGWDFCLNEGHLYMSANDPEETYTGTVAPVHTSGNVIGEDLIEWRYVQDDTVYHADIYNITFDKHLQTKNRSFFLPISQSIYPGTESLSSIYNIKLLNSTFKTTEAKIVIEGTGSNFKDIIVANNIFNNIYVLYYTSGNAMATPIDLGISVTGNTFIDCSGRLIANGSYNSTINCTTSSNTIINSTLALTAGVTNIVQLHGIDIPLNALQRVKLTPIIGDMVRDVDGVWIYKATGWVNLSV